MPDFLKNFIAQEFVPPETYTILGDDSIKLIHPEMLIFIQRLRNDLGVPIIINNWHKGGNFKYRGYRPAGCGVGNSSSQHATNPANALDFDVVGFTADTVRKYLQTNNSRYPMITRIERDVNWVHVDRKDIGSLSKIHLFSA